MDKILSPDENENCRLWGRLTLSEMSASHRCKKKILRSHARSREGSTPESPTCEAATSLESDEASALSEHGSFEKPRELRALSYPHVKSRNVSREQYLSEPRATLERVEELPHRHDTIMGARLEKGPK